MRFMVPWLTVGGWSCLSWVIFLWPIDWKAHQEFRDVVCDIFSVKLPQPSTIVYLLVDLVLVKGDVLSNERRKQLDSVHHSLSWSRSSAGFTEKRFIFDHKQQGRGRQTGWSSALVREKLPNSSRGISHMTNKYILTATAKIRDVWFRSTTK